MPKRIRLIIHEAGQATLDFQRGRDYFKSGTTFIAGKNGQQQRWTSIELDPRHITIWQLLRLFWREAGKLPMDETQEARDHDS